LIISRIRSARELINASWYISDSVHGVAAAGRFTLTEGTFDLDPDIPTGRQWQSTTRRGPAKPSSERRLPVSSAFALFSLDTKAAPI